MTQTVCGRQQTALTAYDTASSGAKWFGRQLKTLLAQAKNGIVNHGVSGISAFCQEAVYGLRLGKHRP
ncbi:hypothetical protein RBA63_01775 [Brenneria goodwinii]|uniref:Uncharacterized protein n=1 Tax=Brenneria goodwinii TaxID=1109412 RepID=A0A0G4JWD6_9GAMM|nr:hypothetical protein BN1221_02672 [Brenneria goodwinii]